MPNYQIIRNLALIFNFDIRSFEDTSINEINIPDKTTLKSIQILNSAQKKEKKYYFEALQHALILETNKMSLLIFLYLVKLLLF